jgi:hypothetical protein
LQLPRSAAALWLFISKRVDLLSVHTLAGMIPVL